MSKNKFNRDDDGLLQNVDYVYDEDGFVNWRKMIKSDYLVPNKDRTSQTDVTKLKDHQVLILLQGIKELAQIRGYYSVTYDVQTPSADYVVATCKIDWFPNYETGGQPVSFSAIGDASLSNTFDFAQNYLAAIAENRAFVRCVRNFLKINIVAKDEIGPNNSIIDKAKNDSEDEKLDSSPKNLLRKIMSQKGVTFDNIKNKLIKEDFDGANDLESVDQIPNKKIFEMISRIQNI